MISLTNAKVADKVNKNFNVVDKSDFQIDDTD